MIKLAAIMIAAAITACTLPSEGTPVDSIYWSDGDSGTVDGIRFRLANVDAPETSGVGTQYGALCESERTLGYESKRFMVDLTTDADMTITHHYDTDIYGRQVVDISVGVVDIGTLGIQEGYLQAWPFENGRALTDKPRWCGQ